MLQVIQTLDQRKQQLRQCALLKMIGNQSLAPESRLSFTPAMLFFVMGFKDILHIMKDEKSTDPMQLSVNVHCDEDSYHWQWYLKDLERISQGQKFLSQKGTDMFSQVWSDDEFGARQVVYDTIHLARTFSLPFYKLIIIESLEATFECFNEPVFELVHTLGRQDELEYFGVLHAHAEADHAMEKTDAAQESEAYNKHEPSKHETENAVFIINKIFDLFEQTFERWYLASEAVGGRVAKTAIAR
ncbi:hypothetical protein [Paraflavitalea sp. CAU 1676]|uniref:hypothetical protein n=1 Tax=Paraflavitalea sp. CAU 1676 TaxID=3032598 RepID=UPI0023DADEED|nr:hypothetical protein [Paraflavitalea sp. CAU 1676]MDF2186793.1 hypothetical protein [Paraflavitalea sp. CAU 1676]